MQPMMTDPMQQYDPATQALIAGQAMPPKPQGMSSSPSAAGQGMGSIAKIAQQLMMMKKMQGAGAGQTPGAIPPAPDPVMGTGYSGQVSPTTQAGSLSSWFNSNPTFGR